MRGTRYVSRNPTASRNATASRNPYVSENPNVPDGLPHYSFKILGPLAPILLSDDYNDPEKLQSRLRYYSVLMLGTSGFFWTWALFNTLHLRRNSGGFDLGVVSFFGSGVSSSFLLRSASGGKCCDRNQNLGCCGKKDGSESRDDATSHAPPRMYLRAFVVLTQLTVAANYMLGILFSFTAGNRVYVYFATYCFIFSLIWLIVAYAGWVLVAVYTGAVARVYGEEVLNSPPRIGLFRAALIALTNRSARQAISNSYYEEEDDIDDELRALYEGRGGYMNA
ncbi:hypothetical protein ACHAW5_010073 [Stephanodiscus triporus]|uniref:Transmembrane protein n=1 Tax=Stephanodiscus triporus TaxID=2934178 RepID=A0ABD3QIP8_9STRA